MMQLRQRRNVAIVRDYRSGRYSTPMLAQRYGISFGRVCQIIRKATGQPLSPVQPRKDA
jgi:hypothetical protein